MEAVVEQDEFSNVLYATSREWKTSFRICMMSGLWIHLLSCGRKWMTFAIWVQTFLRVQDSEQAVQWALLNLAKCYSWNFPWCEARRYLTAEDVGKIYNLMQSSLLHTGLFIYNFKRPWVPRVWMSDLFQVEQTSGLEWNGILYFISNMTDCKEVFQTYRGLYVIHTKLRHLPHLSVSNCICSMVNLSFNQCYENLSKYPKKKFG